MIFFGRKASVLRTEELYGVNCPNCQTSNSLQGVVFGSYAHVYWIPFFPLGKKLATQCRHCKQAVEESELSPAVFSVVQSLRHDVRTPVWNFAGLGVVAVLGVLGTISGNKNAEENRQLLASPAVGDKYELKLGYKDYTIYKVSRVQGDSVYFAVNQYSVNKTRGLSKIDKPENYIDDALGLSHQDLERMQTAGEIVDIER
jgi:hypothetical protein